MRIYPKKGILIITIICLFYSISIFFVVGYSIVFVYIIFLSLLNEAIALFSDQIILSKEDLTVKASHIRKIRINKYKISFKDITQLLYREFKVRGKIQGHYFLIVYIKDGKEKELLINQGIYLIKDLMKLFETLEKEHDIKYEKIYKPIKPEI